MKTSCFFLLLICLLAPLSQLSATPSLSLTAGGAIPITYASADVAEMPVGEEEPAESGKKKPKSSLRKYITWGAIGLIALFLIWFFIRPFIQGLAGKGPAKTKE